MHPAERYRVRPHRRDILDLRAEAQARGGANHRPDGDVVTIDTIVERVTDTPIVLDTAQREFLRTHGIADPDRWLSDQGLGL